MWALGRIRGAEDGWCEPVSTCSRSRQLTFQFPTAAIVVEDIQKP